LVGADVVRRPADATRALRAEPNPPLPADARPADARPADAARELGARHDAWPHTNRVFPWAMAAFIAVIWLLPFDSIATPFSLGVDGTLDRAVLPFVVGLWICCLMTGRADAPRLRPTLIHGAIALFIATAVASVVLNATALANLGELSLAMKKIGLLATYTAFFVVVASGVRREEVPNFCKLLLILACVTAVGTIYEYRSHHNLFYEWSQMLMPASFVVTNFSAAGVDDIGRRLIVGPTQHGLEVSAILAMALPFALVGAIGVRRSRDKVLYGLAAAVILAGMVATYRKTALIAPAAAILVLFAYRPRKMIRLVPLGVVVVVLIHLFTPGAIGSVAVQLTPNRLGGDGTVQGRKSDYDATRPDVLKHPVIGRGYGTYVAQRYRFLDNEWLNRLIETGFLGLMSYLAVILAVMALAHRAIKRRIKPLSDIALAVAAAAVAYAAANALFDTLAFSHALYVFLLIAGLMAAAAIEPPPRGTSRRAAVARQAPRGTPAPALASHEA
jgi:hypothetical protein